MLVNKKLKFIFAIFVFSMLLIIACTKTTDADKQLFELTKNTDGIIWYKKSDKILDKTKGSGHSEPQFRTRFSKECVGVMDSMGKVKNGITFPDGTVIIKELYENNELKAFALMKKSNGDANADENGWIWAEYKSTGKSIISSSSKGKSCKGCHSGNGNIDRSLMNVSLP